MDDNIRDPFYTRDPHDKKHLMLRPSKRGQRYRSATNSRIGGMTVGDIRYCFQQLRSAGENLNSDMILYNGQSAGKFALMYLTETSNTVRSRRKKKKLEEMDHSIGSSSPGEEKVNEEEFILKKSKYRKRMKKNKNKDKKDYQNLNEMFF